MQENDCGCGSSGLVKAKRIAGGRAAGSWGSAGVGDEARVPLKTLLANPENWDWPGKHKDPGGAPESHDTGLQELEALTVPELTAMALEAGVELPARARKSAIIEALEAV